MANGIANPSAATRRSSRWIKRNAATEFNSAQVTPVDGVGSHTDSQASFAMRQRDQARASDRVYGRSTTPLRGSSRIAGQPGAVIDPTRLPRGAGPVARRSAERNADRVDG